MTLNHSKTWPVSTLAVVQLRVDPNGRTYSTQFDGDFISDVENLQNRDVQEDRADEADSAINRTKSSGNESSVGVPGNNGVILPLSQQHVELFTMRTSGLQEQCSSTHNKPATVRTDTVSTILEQDNDIDFASEITSGTVEEETKKVEKFHVLALTKIDETSTETVSDNNRVQPSGGSNCRRPSIRVDNWDLIYTEQTNVAANRSKLCPACTARCNDSSTKLTNYKNKAVTPDYNDRLLVDLPLDARKATTLRRHYYPEGGWGWVIIVCTVLVHVLNVGLQLSCSQLAQPGAEKFKTLPVHIAVELSAKENDPFFHPYLKLHIRAQKANSFPVLPYFV